MNQEDIYGTTGSTRRFLNEKPAISPTYLTAAISRLLGPGYPVLPDARRYKGYQVLTDQVKIIPESGIFQCGT